MESCKQVYTPKSQPQYNPCAGCGTQTDCVALSDGLNDGYLDLSANPSLSEFLSSLVRRIREQDKVIERLEIELDHLKNT